MARSIENRGIAPAVGRAAVEESEDSVMEKVRRLAETCRTECLWFLKAGHVPTDRAQAIRVLSYIERYGNRAAFVEARELREWLSRSSSATSVDS